MLEHVFLSKQKKARQDPKPVIDKVAKRYGIYANMLVDTLVTMDKQSIKNIVYDMRTYPLATFIGGYATRYHLFLWG